MKLFDVYPLFDVTPVKGEGCFIYDEQGEKYLDLYGGHAVISVGHSHPQYVNAISEQLQQIGFYSNSVKILCRKSWRKSWVKFPAMTITICSCAIRELKPMKMHSSWLLSIPGRKKIVSFTRSFHGRTSAAVAATDDRSILAPVNESADFIFCEFNNAVQLKEIFRKEEIAAVIIEGIQGVGGVNIPSPEFLHCIKFLCETNGALMICDEIQSGYGRSGKFFAHQHTGVRADLITVAKGMGNWFSGGRRIDFSGD